MNGSHGVVAPGARIVVRDAEWLVRRVDRTSTGGLAIAAVGISELVRDKEAIFLDEIEPSIEVLDPSETKLVPDTSSAYQASLLYLESLLRRTPPTDENLYIGHQAAMDAVPYQLDPAIQALEQTRARILIADAVGLGKTLEAGVLLSELIRRGRGKRILVVAVKSMLTQFQKEMWSRFTIPLTRLDSIGIQRIRSRIPTNQNPFYYYDRAIISIDTLKQDSEYRTYLENAYWDVIVIDEAHNVAERGTSSSLRAKLAKLLAQRSDTLIMLSATPHDGRARSFASLMNMLDPTAIADPDNYGPDDIKGLYIRRFKKDIQNQVQSAFKEREIAKAHCESTSAEEQAFDLFTKMSFVRLDRNQGAGELFKTTLEKALFSSPAACLQTIKNRVGRLRKEANPESEEDIGKLEELAAAVHEITPSCFSKYQKLLKVITDTEQGLGWTGKEKDDRLVIFTERIETLRFLQENLIKDLSLDEDAVRILHGGMSDVDQQEIVEDFGKEEAPIRLLIASDVASEGINLHYLSHRMIHFDIPWSLMVFQQRNGRIDRYGQEKTPQILYLVTESQNKRIRGDMRILELLIEKDKQAEKNIGDPAAFYGVYDIDEEEKITAKAIESGQTAEAFDAFLDAQKNKTFDPLALLLGQTDEQPKGQKAESSTRKMTSLFNDDIAYLQVACAHLHQTMNFDCRFYPAEQRVDLTAPEELVQRFRFLPPETWPDDHQFLLSSNRKVIQNEIKRSRKDEKAWPQIHYLWDLNPVVDWINDKVLAAFGRHEAPVVTLYEGLEPLETVFLMSGLIPNRKGHPLVHEWFGVVFHGGKFKEIEEFPSIIARTHLGQIPHPNRKDSLNLEEIKQQLPAAVDKARQWMSGKRNGFEKKINVKLQKQLDDLDRLRGKQYQQLEFRFSETKFAEKTALSRKEKERRRIDEVFDEFIKWVEETMTTEDRPFLQVAAVLRGRGHGH